MASTSEMTSQYLKHYAEIYQDDFYVSEPGKLYDVLNNKIPVVKHEVTSEKQDVNLDEVIKSCQLCSLSQGRRKAVPGIGNLNASLMIVGNAPVQDDDLKGLPFTGPSGKLLDNILKAIDFHRDEVFMTHVVKCKTPMHRDPEPDEMKACSGYLRKQMMQIAPKIILALGRVSGEAILHSQLSIQGMREKVHQHQGIAVFVTHHPESLLNDVKLKKEVWTDVQKLRHYYDEHVGDKGTWQPGNN